MRHQVIETPTDAIARAADPASISSRVRRIFATSVNANGNIQALQTNEVHEQYFRLYGEMPRGLSKKIAAIKSDGDIRQINRGVYIWARAAWPKGPTVLQLQKPRELPQRAKQVVVDVFDLEPKQVHAALSLVGMKISTRLLSLLVKERWIPGGTTVNGGKRRYSKNTIEALLQLRMAANGFQPR